MPRLFQNQTRPPSGPAQACDALPVRVVPLLRRPTIPDSPCLRCRSVHPRPCPTRSPRLRCHHRPTLHPSKPRLACDTNPRRTEPVETRTSTPSLRCQPSANQPTPSYPRSSSPAARCLAARTIHEAQPLPDLAIRPLPANPFHATPGLPRPRCGPSGPRLRRLDFPVPPHEPSPTSPGLRYLADTRPSDLHVRRLRRDATRDNVSK